MYQAAGNSAQLAFEGSQCLPPGGVLPPPPQIEQLFAVTVPGRPMSLSWNIVASTRAVLVEPVTDASDVPDIMVALMPGSSFFKSRPSCGDLLVSGWCLLVSYWSFMASATFTDI